MSDIFWLLVQLTNREYKGLLDLIVHNYSLLYKLKTGAQLKQGNDSCLNALAHVSVLYLNSLG